MKVALIMGSISDKDIAKKTCDILKKFGIEYDADLPEPEPSNY